MSGASACLSSLRRPGPEMAPTDAKASCHYPQAARALREAAARGFANAVMCDPLGNVAEFATANLFLAKDGVVVTPAANGTFLNGITRQRILSLLREDGIAVEERTVTRAEVLGADEVFATGNYGKVTALTRIEDRDLQPGPMFRRARELYWDFAHSTAA
jgi:branched-chain amino acid aminotransferase